VAHESFVVDTSVLVRWFLAQAGWEHARKIRDSYLTGQTLLETVECARFEMPWVLRKHGLLRGYLTKEQYLAAARSIDDLGIRVIYTDADAVQRAAELSADRVISFFDAVFVLRSLETGNPLLTADRRLARSVSDLVSTLVLDGIDA